MSRNSPVTRLTTRIPRRRVLAALPLALGFACPALAKKKKKPKGDSDGSGQAKSPLGVLAGSVFTSDGQSLPGAEVSVVNEANPKIKAKGVSDIRGEFAFRLPAGAGPYVVRAEAKGFQAVEKKAEVYDSQKTNLNLLLSPR